MRSRTLTVLAPLLAIAGGGLACTSGLPDDTSGEPDETGDTDEPDDGPTVDITVVGFNVEGNDADLSTLEATIAGVEGEVLWGFSEVPTPDWAIGLRDAAADDVAVWNHIYGGTGWEQRLVLAWNADELELIGSEELQDINVGGTARAPLVGTFEHIDTGVRFKAMVNHLWRSDTGNRHEQAQKLNDWARVQGLPVIAVGDYNFDYQLDGSYRDDGFDLMTEGGTWEWVEPDPNIATHCGGSVLDFTFVAGDAQDWNPRGEVLSAYDGYCPDSDRRSDHRPVAATLALPAPE